MRPKGSSPYSVLKLHARNDRCWAVIDANGAVVDLDGMAMRMTLDEAETFASERNRASSADRVQRPEAPPPGR